MKIILERLLLFIMIIALLSCEKGSEDVLSINDSRDVKFSPLAKSEENRYIEVSTNQATWDVTSSEDWCIVTKDDFGFTISAKPNPCLYYVKYAKIDISAGNAKPIQINVLQDPVLFAVMSESEYFFGEEGGKFDIHISCNTEWSITSNKEWISASPQYGCNNDDIVVNVKVEANTELQEDSAILSVCAGEGVENIIIHREAMKIKYQIGDLYPDNINPIGMVFSISNEGRNGKIFSLHKEYVHQWSSEYYRTYAIDPNDGQYNMQKILERLKLPTRHVYPAFMLCRDLGDEWYLPACYEMIDIYNCWNGGAGEENKSARDKCNSILEKHNGVPLKSLYTHYTTSTEWDANSYIYIDFNHGTYETEKWDEFYQVYNKTMNTFPKQTLGCIRPIRTF